MTRRKFPQILRRTESQADIEAYISRRGVTRCPTACATQTQASPSPADRAALERYAILRERVRRERLMASRMRTVEVLQPVLLPQEVEEDA